MGRACEAVERGSGLIDIGEDANGVAAEQYARLGEAQVARRTATEVASTSRSRRVSDRLMLD